MFKKSFAFGLFGSLLISGIISIVLAIHSSAQGADNAVSIELLMQKAYYAQRSEGDMEKAIDLYSQVIAQNAADREYAAQACYQLGLCYQTKNDSAKAIEYYRKTVSEFKDIEKWRDKAAVKLTELGDIADSSDPGTIVLGNVPAEVKSMVGDLLAGVIEEAQSLQCDFNCHYYLVEDDMSVSAGVIGVVINSKDTPMTGKVHLGGSSYNNSRYYTVDGRRLTADFIPAVGRKDHWNIYLTLPEPLPVSGQLVYVTISDSPHKTSRDDQGNVAFNMQNYFGSKCLETFILITRSDVELVSKSDEYTEKVTAGGCNIYNFKKLMSYGENHKVSVTVRGKQGGENPQIMAAPALLPVPWSDGDSFLLDIKLKTGVSIGSLKYSFSTVEKAGKQCWQIAGEQSVDAGAGKSEQKTLVIADKQTYRPVYGSTENTLGSFAADYSEKSVALKVKDGGTQDIAVTGTVYDNEQVMCMLRMLPLAENYACKFNIFPVLSGVVIECQISVLATETVTVPAGEFACYKIALSCWSNGLKALEHYIWVSSDDKRQIVKYDAGSAEMVLSQINGQTPAATTGGPAANVVAAAAVKADKAEAEKLAAQGWKLWQKRELEQATEKFQQAVAKDPTNENAFQGLGWALFNQGLNTEAADAFEKCIAINSKNAAALNGLGWIAKAGGDMDKAVAYWVKAVDAAPGVTASLSGLVDHYTEKGDNEQVVKYLKLWHKAEPDNNEVAEKLKAAQGKDSASIKGVQVISTNPEVYSGSAPATLEAIEVTFNTTMKNGGWSWTGGGDTFPESAGSISYDSKRRTCRMPVKLQPGKVYWVGINSPSHKNFKSAKGEPAKRYVILFATAGADGSPTEIPADLLEKAKAINGSK